MAEIDSLDKLEKFLRFNDEAPSLLLHIQALRFKYFPVFLFAMHRETGFNADFLEILGLN